jgi:hypothetical protein
VAALTPLKGICYVPYTSDWAENRGDGQKYFDTDYTNSCFPLLWGTDNSGRGDLKGFHGLGVNFLRLYDWSAPPSPPGGSLTLNLRNHLPFLDECARYGIKVTIPVSNYNVYNINNPNFTWIKPNIEAIVEEAYQGKTTPHPAAAMIAVGNEILYHAQENGLTYEEAVQYAIEVVEVILQKEAAMGIPQANKLLITLPLSTGTFGHGDVGGVYGLTLIQQYAEASAVCQAHDFLTDRYIISLNVEMDSAGTKTYLGQIKTAFPDTPILFTEYGTGRDDIADELRAVMSSEKPFTYFDDALMGVSIFTWVGEPGQTYSFPVARTNGVSSYGTIEPSDYLPGGGAQYPVDKIDRFSVCDDIRNIYTGKNAATVTSGSAFTVKLPADHQTATTGIPAPDGHGTSEAFFSRPDLYITDKNGTSHYAQVLTANYPTDDLECRWEEPVDPGVYPLFADTDGQRHLITNYFEISGPVVSEILSTTITETGDFEVRGRYFGQGPGVFFTYYDPVSGRLRTATCAITTDAATQIMDSASGRSVVNATVPENVRKLLQGGSHEWLYPGFPVRTRSHAAGMPADSYRTSETPTRPSFSIGSSIDTTHDPINPDSVLDPSHVWFTDMTETPNGNRFLFRGNEPLTDGSTTNGQQMVDFPGLYAVLKQKYENQTKGGNFPQFPTDIKLIDVPLIGGRDSEGEILYREYVSFGGTLPETPPPLEPGQFQPADGWYQVPGLTGISIQGKLLWQPTAGIASSPTQASKQTDAEAILKAQAPCFGSPDPCAHPLFEIVSAISDIMNNEGDAKDDSDYNGDMIIYVHCMHGHDRTSEVIVPYLIRKKKSEGSYMYGTISDAVNEAQVQGSSQIDFKYKKLKEPYGHAVEWYYIYVHGDASYQMIPKKNREGW